MEEETPRWQLDNGTPVYALGELRRRMGLRRSREVTRVCSSEVTHLACEVAMAGGFPRRTSQPFFRFSLDNDEGDPRLSVSVRRSSVIIVWRARERQGGVTRGFSVAGWKRRLARAKGHAGRKDDTRCAQTFARLSPFGERRAPPEPRSPGLISLPSQPRRGLWKLPELWTRKRTRAHKLLGRRPTDAGVHSYHSPRLHPSIHGTRPRTRQVGPPRGIVAGRVLSVGHFSRA